MPLLAGILYVDPARRVGLTVTARFRVAGVQQYAMTVAPVPGNAGVYYAPESAVAAAGVAAGTYAVELDDGQDVVAGPDAYPWDGTHEVPDSTPATGNLAVIVQPQANTIVRPTT